MRVCSIFFHFSGGLLEIIKFDSSRFKVTNLTSWPFWILRPRAHHPHAPSLFLTWISQLFHNLSDGHRSLQLFFSTSNAKMIGPILLCLCEFSREVHSLEDGKTQLKFAARPSLLEIRKVSFQPSQIVHPTSIQHLCFSTWAGVSTAEPRNKFHFSGASVALLRAPPPHSALLNISASHLFLLALRSLIN